MAEATTCFVRMGKPDAVPQLRLIAFPNAGGGAAALVRCFRTAPSWLEAWAFQPPGRENRAKEPVCNRMEELIESLVAEISELPTMPTVLLGHSLGGWVAWEIAKSEVIADLQGLIVLCSIPPSEVFATGPHLTQLDDATLLKTLSSQSQGVPEAILNDRSWWPAIVPPLRGDITIIENYTPADTLPVDCPILALGGQNDHLIPSETLAGWKHLTRGGYEQHILEGDHYLVQNSAPAVSQIVYDYLTAHHL